MAGRKRSGGRVTGRRAGRGHLGRAIQRGTLSREVILRAALRVADRDGLNGLTMRKLAAGLGASPMALYRHFRNKEEIVDGLVDVVVGDYDVTNHDETDCCDWLRETFRLMHEGLCEHPGIIPLLGGAAFSGRNATGVAEQVLAVLRKTGLDERNAALLFYSLMSYTIGAVGFANARGGETAADSPGRLEEQLRHARLAFEMASRTTYPTIVALAPYLALFSTEQQFIAGLDRILFAALDPRD